MEDKIENKEVETPRFLGVMDKASGYARGAVMGGIAGFLFAVTTGKKPILWSVVGIIGGGWIGYRIAEATDTSKQTKFNFTDKPIVKRKFKTTNK